MVFDENQIAFLSISFAQRIENNRVQVNGLIDNVNRAVDTISTLFSQKSSYCCKKLLIRKFSRPCHLKMASPGPSQGLAQNNYKLIPNRLGGRTLLHVGFAYNLHRNNKKSSVWTCVNKRHGKCNGAVKLSEESDNVQIQRCHNAECQPNLFKNEVKVVMEKLKEDVKTNFSSIQQNFEAKIAELQSTCTGFEEYIPKYNNVKQQFYNSRKKALNVEKTDPEAVVEDEEAEMRDEVSKVCRACLATGVRMVDVAASGLQDTFEHVTGTELHTTDERPTQVCYVCCSQLQRFRAFCQMSRKAETYMTKLVKKGLQITEQAVSKRRHRLIKPKLDVTKNPLVAIHTHEDTDECVPIEVKVEVDYEVEDKNRSDSETESENEIGSEVKTGTYMSESGNETEERQPDWEPEGEIKIETDELDIEEFDPFEAVENTTVNDETCCCIQCAETFPSQSELLKHIQNHTQKKLKQGNATIQDVKAKITKRDVKTNLSSQCKFCNKTFAIQAQLVTHVVKEHGIGEFSQEQERKRRKPNILKKSQD